MVGTSDYSARGEAKPVFPNIAGTAVAAGRFATWLVDDFKDPLQTPLRTVRVLLSKMPSEDDFLPENRSWEPATDGNVALALERWKHDCNSDSGNVAILYAGGHGTVTTDGAQHIFLSNANVLEDRYRMSISVSVIKDLMRNCHARSNVYVFDCCALTEGQIPDVIQTGGVRIAPFTDNPGPKRKYEFTITAARVGTASHTLGPKDGTLLSWALLPLLKTAGKLIDEFFTVTKEKLDEQLLPAMRGWQQIKLPRGHEPVVKGDADPSGFTRPQPPPTFPISFVSDPEAAGRTVTVTISDRASGQTKMQKLVNGGNNAPFELPAGPYNVMAEIRSGGERQTSRFKLDVDQSLQIFAFTGEAAP